MNPTQSDLPPRDVPMGATPADGGVRFRVWAPSAEAVDVALANGAQPVPMVGLGDGTWGATVPGTGEGTRYRFQLNGRDAFPDPCSRFQPEGVHGPSEVVDLAGFPWTDAGWKGVGMRGLVIYEAHVGTATPEGTFDALITQLDRLARLGVTALQLMPVAEFSGTRNWGYDGVYPYAATRGYGGPRGLMRLVDAAHARGLGVLLDVVYNHLGPEGNYLRQFSPAYFTSSHQTPWGDAVNYDAEGSVWVRRYVVDNALQWVRDFHLDGLRLDATHEIRDDSPRHVLQELTDEVRAVASARGREVVVIAETDENDVRYLKSTLDGGFGFDAVWADDFHHALRRYLAGDHEGYYADYLGTLSEVARALQQGWLYEGEFSPTLRRRRGTPAREQPAWQFQLALQNHDQVGNRPFGDRLHHMVSLDLYRAASALLLLSPYTPLLFMGQEFVASSPFQYFTDHGGGLGPLVTEGRRKEFGGFSAFADAALRETIPDPQAEETFLRSRLRLEETREGPGAAIHLLYTVLLGLRRADPVLRRQDRGQMHVRALTETVLALHMWEGTDHRLLLANFGAETSVDLQAVLARQGPREWFVICDTGEKRFGGPEAGVGISDGVAGLPARTAALLAGTTKATGPNGRVANPVS